MNDGLIKINNSGHLRAVRFLILCFLFVIPHAAWSLNMGLSADPNPNNGAYTLSWNSLGQGTYRVQERVSGTSTWYLIFYSGTATSHFIDNKAAGSYDYRVRWRLRTCSGGGRRGRGGCETFVEFSETISVEVRNQSPPSAPANFKSVPIGLDGPAWVKTVQHYSLTWNASTDATAYELEERLDSSIFEPDPNIGVWRQIYSGAETSVQIYAKKIESTYSYRVRACNADPICGDWSPIVSVVVFLWRPPPSPPPPPPPDEDQIAVTWNAFRSALDNGDVASAIEQVSPSARGKYEPALLALGSNVQFASGNWSEIKEIQTTGTLAEYTIFQTINGVQRMHIITFQKVGSDWKLLEF